eukprot:1158434-Pelagomonas_calceolata.AAC.10
MSTQAVDPECGQKDTCRARHAKSLVLYQQVLKQLCGCYPMVCTRTKSLHIRYRRIHPILFAYVYLSKLQSPWRESTVSALKVKQSAIHPVQPNSTQCHPRIPNSLNICARVGTPSDELTSHRSTNILAAPRRWWQLAFLTLQSATGNQGEQMVPCFEARSLSTPRKRRNSIKHVLLLNGCTSSTRASHHAQSGTQEMQPHLNGTHQLTNWDGLSASTTTHHHPPLANLLPLCDAPFPCHSHIDTYTVTLTNSIYQLGRAREVKESTTHIRPVCRNECLGGEEPGFLLLKPTLMDSQLLLQLELTKHQGKKYRKREHP